MLTFKANLPVTENPSPQDKRRNRLSLVENSSSRAAVNVRKGAISFPEAEMHLVQVGDNALQKGPLVVGIGGGNLT